MAGRLLTVLPGKWRQDNGGGGGGGGGWVLPRALVTGVTTRSYSDLRTTTGGQGPLYPLVTAGVGGGVVIDPDWSVLQPTAGALSTTAVDALIAQLDDCQSLNLKVRLRVRGGLGAPDWVGADAAVGQIPWATNHGTDPSWTPATGDTTGTWFMLPGGIPQCWRPRYWELWRDFSFLLAQDIGDHPALAEVVQALSSTQFQEPCIMQLNWQPNLDAAIGSGFSESVWDSMFAESFTTHMLAWAPRRVACYAAWNPAGAIVVGATPSGFKFTNGNVARTIRLMEAQVRICGGLAVVGNNSLVGPVEPNATYRQMYDRIVAFRQAVPPNPIGFQTETLAKHVSAYPTEYVQGTLTRAISMGADNAELPIGCQTLDAAYPLNHITPALAATYNAALKANAVGLWDAGQVPMPPGPPVLDTPIVTGTANPLTATIGWLPQLEVGDPPTGFNDSITPTGPVLTPTSLDAAARTVTITGLTGGVAYTYSLSAFNVTGSSVADTVTFTPVAAVGVPGAPTLRTPVVSGTANPLTAAISWSAPTTGGAQTGYADSISPAGPVVTPASPGAGALGVTVTGLTSGTAYTYTLWATNGAGSGPTDAVVFTPTIPSTGTAKSLQTCSFAYGPGTQGPGSQAMADAHADYFDLVMCKSRFWAPYVASMKARNPDIELWDYFNGTMGSLTAALLVCTDAGGNYTLDSVGFSTLHVQDPRITAWRNDTIANVQIAKNAGFTGAFNDNFGPALFSSGYLRSNPAGHSPTTPVAAGFTWATWCASLVTLVGLQRAAVPGIKIVSNELKDGQGWFSSTFNTTLKLGAGGVEGSLAEIWGRDARNAPAMFFKNEAQWKQDVDMLVDALVRFPNRQIAVSVKHWSAPLPTAAEALQVSRYFLASYLLGACDPAGNNNAYFAYNNAWNGTSSYIMDPRVWPFSFDWKIDPGLPLGPYTNVGSIYGRQFVNGLVLVNPTTASGSWTVTGGPWLALPASNGATRVTVSNGSLTVPAHTGVILTRT